MASLSTNSSDSSQAVSDNAQNDEPVRCPITFKRLNEITDPVFLTSDGYIYERAAIVKWLDDHHNSPVNRNAASSDDVRKVYATLSNKSPASTTAVRQILILAIDVSSSMLTPVSVKVQDNAGSTTEVSHGLSRADVALHSAKSVINAATDKNVIGIVVFGTGARDVFQPTVMDAKGKQEALNTITSLRIQGSTYLNDGIRHSLTMADQAGCYYPGATKHIWILSDGEPQEPTNNHVENLKTYQINRMASTRAYNLLKSGMNQKDIQSHVNEYRASLVGVTDPITEWSISTFAYGTECDSDLLWQISNQGNGGFGFIPDAGWVETVFTHFFSNLLVPDPVSLATAQDEKRLAFIKVLEAVVSIVPHGYVRSSPFLQPVPREITTDDLSNARDIYDQYMTGDVGIWTGKDKDGFDQISIALQCDEEGDPYWRSWGRPYVKGLICAVNRKECTNKRDPCLQQFGRGQEWRTTRDKITSLFCEMPPPVPTNKPRKRRRSSGSSSTARSSPPLSLPNLMRSYSQAVCFHADTMVKCASGFEVECHKLTPGTKLVTCKIVHENHREYLERSTDEIECIVKTAVTNPKFCKLVSQHSRQDPTKETALYLTPWHPVATEVLLLHEGNRVLHQPHTWEFPFRIGSIIAPEHPKCDGDIETGLQYVYSFLMKNRSVGILCDSFWSITLAHGVDFGVAKHDFWGTEKVAESLVPFTESGIAVIKPSNIQRDVRNNVVALA